VHDAKKAELLWTEELRDWFPVGPSDPDLALIQVDVEEAEYWDSKVNRLASVVKGLFFASEKKQKHDKIDWPEAVS
ncbi:MAG TPA: pyridoxamine 5'-phosphate oxidase family protein, partial [Pirellulaceae bacterium]|nr:pyridoxamine 5'-phosphate oxidase family protein [Pirellulaceae bacterium]